MNNWKLLYADRFPIRKVALFYINIKYLVICHIFIKVIFFVTALFFISLSHFHEMNFIDTCFLDSEVVLEISFVIHASISNFEQKRNSRKYMKTKIKKNFKKRKYMKDIWSLIQIHHAFNEVEDLVLLTYMGPTKVLRSRLAMCSMVVWFWKICKYNTFYCFKLRVLLLSVDPPYSSITHGSACF